MNRFLFLLCIFIAPCCFAQTATSLKLIPTPQKLEMKEGRFTFNAGQLKDGVPESIKFIQSEKPVASSDSPEAYLLRIAPKAIEIHSSAAAGQFYGVQTLKQLIRTSADAKNSIPCCEITDWPALKYRVWQDDISRGPIPSMDFLKRQVRLLSELKYNAMTLYTEHVFKLKQHPTIAPEDGISAEQIKELSEYAKQYHVELIGNFQSFGHMRKILTTPGYEQLGDNTWNISPAKEESYKFLAECYAEVAPAYESELFDINCDEVTLGREGASKEMVAKLGLAEVYSRHINRVCDLLKPYKKTAMMWGDIATEHQDIVPKLPKDLIVLAWGYGARESFDDQIEPFTKIGLRFMVCPGVSCWNRVFPDFKAASINIANFVRDGVQHGAIGMINTSWDDDGENLFNQTWYPFAWGAEVSWNPIVPKAGENANTLRQARQKDFDATFAGVFFDAPDDAITKALWDLSNLRANPASGNLDDRQYWRDELADAPERVTAKDAEQLVKDADKLADDLKKLKSTAKINADLLDSAIFAARRASTKARIFLLLTSIEREVRDNGKIDQRGRESLGKIVAEMTQLKTEYARLWRQENREWWLDRNLEKFDKQIALLKSTPLRVLFSPQDVAFDSSVDVTILPISSGGQIRFTRDGTDPDETSSLYSKPMHLEQTATIKARHFVNGQSAPQADSQMYRTFILPATVETTLHQYQDFGPVRAFDGVRESWFWGKGEGDGIKSGDHFTITLNEAKSVTRVAALTGNRDHPEDTLQNGVLEISTDGKTFEKIADFKKNGWGEARLDAAKTIKAVRLRATGDQKSWLIIREITLE